MRTKELKIGNKKVSALLVAGGPGFKLYSAAEVNGWILNIGRKVLIIAENSEDYTIVTKYINLRYQPLNVQASIKNEFDAFIFGRSSPPPLATPEQDL